MAVEGGPIAQAAVELIADFDRFSDDVKAKFRRAAQEAGKDFDKTIQDKVRDTGEKVADRTSRGAGGGGRRAGITWSDAFRQAIAFRITNQSLRAIFTPLIGIGNLLGFATGAAAIASTAAALIQFTAAATPAVGIVLALPSALAIGAAGFLALRVAMIGVGDAFEAALSGDPKKFAESLKDLSPAAQSVAKELHALRPALLDVKNAVQEAFFGPLKGQLAATAQVLAGPFQAGMVSVAGATSQVAVGIAEIARQSATVQLVNQAFSTTTASVNNLRPGLLAIVTGFRDLGLVALPIFQQMSGSLGGVAQQFGEWLSRVSASGQAFQWIQNAITVLRQLGDVVVQIGGIIAAVFRAGQATGGGLIQTFADLLRSANAFLSSAEGQDALIAIFASLKSVAGALQPILKEVFVQFGQFAPLAAQIAVALGPGLTSLVQTLGQALKGLGPGLVAVGRGLSEGLVKAGPGIVKLGEAFGRLLEALAPILPLIGEIVGVLAGAFAEALNALIPVLTPVVEALVEALAPILPQIAQAFTTIVTALAPVMPLLGQLLVIAIQFIGIGLEVVFALIAAAVNVLAFAINVLVAAATWLWNNVLVPLGNFLAAVFGPVISAIGVGLSALGSAFSAVASAASWLWNNVLAPFGNFLAGVFRGAIAGVKAVLDGIGAVFRAIGDAANWLWRNVLQPLGDFLGSVFRPVIDGISWAFNAVKTAIDAVVNVIRTLIGWIKDAISWIGDLVSKASSIGSVIGSISPFGVFSAGPGPGPEPGPGPTVAAGPAPKGGLGGALAAMPRIPMIGPGQRPGFNLTVVAAPTARPAKQVTVNAPITVMSQSADPLIVARRATDEIAELAQA